MKFLDPIEDKQVETYYTRDPDSGSNQGTKTMTRTNTDDFISRYKKTIVSPPQILIVPSNATKRTPTPIVPKVSDPVRTAPKASTASMGAIFDFIKNKPIVAIPVAITVAGGIGYSILKMRKQ